ncbi:MAG: hypothetical protein JSV86_16180 [Gemmatimonadota bacterium]|nr:MAG: hypothetical protein JSV86_16180 [Gemmatimonadota bacterium]
MSAPRIVHLVAAFVLPAWVAIIVSACEPPTTGPYTLDPPDFLVTVSVTPDTAHPQDSVLVQTMVRNIGGSGYQPRASGSFWSLTLADKGATHFYFHVPYLAPKEQDTVRYWVQLNGWPAPDSVQVMVAITRIGTCGWDPQYPQTCYYHRFAFDTLVVAP